MAAIVAATLGATASPLHAQVRPALAEPARETPLGERLTGLAKAEYAAARVLYADGDFAGARRKFEEAHRISGEPRLLWNIAACEKAERRYARARRTLERYRDAARANLTEEERARVDELVQNLAPFVSTVVLAIDPQDAETAIDGEVMAGSAVAAGAAGPGEAAFFVDLGRHVVEVRKAGWLPFTRSVDLRGGETLRVEVRLERDVRVGTLRISTDPDATVFVDGSPRGVGSRSLEVSAGAHTVRVTAPDRRDFVADVAVEKGGTRSLDASLEEESQGLPAWLWIAGGTLLLAGAVTTAVVVATDAGGVTPVQGSFGTVDIGEF